MKNLFKIRGEMYETSRFGQKFKKKFGYGNWKRNSKVLEHFRNSRMTWHLLVAVWTLRVSRHHNQQSSQQETLTRKGVVGG